MHVESNSTRRLNAPTSRRDTTHGVSITLSEAESRRVVAKYGVPVSPFVTGNSPDEVLAAVSADATITYPVVAKLCGRAIAHKTERGLVRLGIADADALRAACVELLGKALPEDGRVEVLVSSMVDGNRELIAGLNADPQFGMTVMVGVGGILAEAIRDVSFRLAPITTVDAAEMLDVADRVGSIEAGKDADFVVLEGHPFDYRVVPQMVFVDGRLEHGGASGSR